MSGKTEVLHTAEPLLMAALGSDSQQFRPVLEGIARGEHVIVSGLPSSGKTTLLAVLLNCVDEALALSGSGAQAKALARSAFDLRQDNAVVGDSRSFASAIWGFFNDMRNAAHRNEIRLLSDAEVLGWMDPWMESGVPEELVAAARTQGFRQNLLDGIYRVRSIENPQDASNVNPWVQEVLGKLRQRAKDNQSQGGKSPWELDAGSLYEEYLQALDSGRMAVQPDLVLLDDWQNANGLMQRIVLKWAATGTQVIAVGLPDLSCNEYRGGNPGVLEHLARRLEDNPSGRKVTRATLTKMYVSAQLGRFWRDAVNTFGATGGVDLWKPQGETHPADDTTVVSEEYLCGVHLLQAPTDARQYRLIGEFLQEAHLFSESPIPYAQMAVLVNSNVVGKAVEQQLKGLGIPASRAGANSQINEGRFSGWLLRLLQVTCAETWDFADFLVTDFLQSEFFGWGAARLRKLDEALKTLVFPVPRKSDYPEPQDFEDALSTWELDTNKLGTLPWVKEFWQALRAGEPFHGKDLDALCTLGDAKKLVALHEVLMKVQELWKKDSGNVQMMLWSLWDGLGRGEELRELSFTPELDAMVRDQLNLELDLVMDLFKAADWYEQRYPGGDAAEFARKMLDRTLPTGTVAPHHQSADAVTITTSIGAVSRHWKVVAVVGLNEGAWPSNTWPGDLLGTSMFDLSQKEVGTGGIEGKELVKAGFQWSFRADFRRFLAAITRATQTLVLGCTKGDFENPSPLVRRLADHPGIKLHVDLPVGSSGKTGEIPAGVPLGDRLPSNLRDMIARLRMVTMLSDAEAADLAVSAAQRSEAAGLLAWLGNSQSVEWRVANPDNWLGVLRPSCPDASLAEAGDDGESQAVYRIRASGLENLLNNPFDTEMARLGYQDVLDTEYNPAVIGILIHKVAEEMGRRHWSGDNPETKVDFLEYETIQEESAAILERLLEGSRSENWVFVNFEKRLKYLLTRMTEFLYHNQYPSRFECGYRMVIPDRNQRGAIAYTARIDRVLFSPTGIILADYKTGNPASYSVKSVANDLQLLLYQKAFNEGTPMGSAPQGRVADGAWIVALKGDRVVLRSQNSLAKHQMPIEINHPLTGEHRLLLQNPQCWLEKKRRGETDFGPGDLDTMTLRDFLQDRVDLAVAALANQRLVQRREVGNFFKADTLAVEVENDE